MSIAIILFGLTSEIYAQTKIVPKSVEARMNQNRNSQKFTFEDSKLEFAKNAYANCSNKDDYYMLNEAFTFSSSKSELNKYVSNQ
jgi:hypothetical protein